MKLAFLIVATLCIIGCEKTIHEASTSQHGASGSIAEKSCCHGDDKDYVTADADSCPMKTASK